MKNSISAVVLLMLFSNLAWAAKKPAVSFGLFGGFTASGLFNANIPSRDFNFGNDEYWEYPAPYKSYMPERLLKADKDFYGFGIEAFDYETSFFKDMVYNIAAGLAFDIPIKKSNWAFRMHGSYQTTGLNLKNERTETKKVDENEITFTTLYRRDVKNTYLVMPMMLKYSWPGRTTYFVQAGPYAGLLLKSKIVGSSLVAELETDNYSAYEFTVDSADFQTHKLDYGVNFGGGMEFYWTSTASITLEVNTGIGLRKLDKLYNNDYEEYQHDRKYAVDFSSKNYFSLSSNARNFYVMFTVGFRYSLYK